MSDDYQIRVTVPMSLSSESCEALFSAVADAVALWEQVWEPVRDGWDADVVGSPVSDWLKEDQG